MKKLYSRLFTAVFTLLACIQLSWAQTQVNLKINHLCDGELLKYNHNYQNDLGQEFSFSRVAYYISYIQIYHDGGQLFQVDEFWILEEVNINEIYELAEVNVQHIDSISFGIGVEKSVNHADPTLYPSDHPLAIQSPSMHWGWAGGYRFAVLEGQAGLNSSEHMEFHCLEDTNYFTQTIVVDQDVASSEHTIYIEADYKKAFDGVDLSEGIIVHDKLGKARQIMLNFRDKVFDISDEVTSVNEEVISNLEIYPNPVTGGRVNFSETINNCKVYDMQGKLVYQTNEALDFMPTYMLIHGVYIIEGVSSNGERFNQKLIIY